MELWVSLLPPCKLVNGVRQIEALVDLMPATVKLQSSSQEVPLEPWCYQNGAQVKLLWWNQMVTMVPPDHWQMLKMVTRLNFYIEARCWKWCPSQTSNFRPDGGNCTENGAQVKLQCWGKMLKMVPRSSSAWVKIQCWGQMLKMMPRLSFYVKTRCLLLAITLTPRTHLLTPTHLHFCHRPSPPTEV